MEVTTTNFYELLPQIREAISNATFLSIDCEFTGLNTVSEVRPYDTSKQYYEKVRRASKDFLIIQYGLCIFRYEPNENVFKQCAYNFYIFPNCFNKYAPDRRFLCQASSINFLISQGFNFNKLFTEGICYLNVQEEEKYMASLMEKQKQRAEQMNLPGQNGTTTIPEENVEFIENVFKQITDFIESDQEELMLPKCNSFVRRLIYQTASQRVGNSVSLETKLLDNKERALYVTKSKKETKEEREQKRVEEELQEFEKCKGFSKILQCIVNSNKLVVGHNMCLDLLHTIDKFVTPVPEDYEEFKECAHTLFPKILDTKHMSTTNEFKDLIDSSVLNHLFSTVLTKPFEIPKLEVEDGKEGYIIDDTKEHEAGYDAFITGVSLLAMWKYLGQLKKKRDVAIFKDLRLLEPYTNKIYLMRLQDGLHIHLGGKDPVPNRDHVLYVSFPKEWKASDLILLFSPFGNIFISWIDDNSAYISLYRKDQAAIALTSLSKSKDVTVMTYAKRQAIMTNESYICSSPHPTMNKRFMEEGNTSTKKRRTGSSGEDKSKRSIDPIAEEDEEDENDENLVSDNGIQKESSEEYQIVLNANSRKRLKTFEEESDWD